MDMRRVLIVRLKSRGNVQGIAVGDVRERVVFVSWLEFLYRSRSRALSALIFTLGEECEETADSCERIWSPSA